MNLIYGKIVDMLSEEPAFRIDSPLIPLYQTYLIQRILNNAE
jgi:hypothetical protein